MAHRKDTEARAIPAVDGTTVRVAKPWRETSRKPHRGSGETAGTVGYDATSSEWLLTLKVNNRPMPTRATTRKAKPKVIRKVIKDIYVPPTARKHVQPKSFYKADLTQ